MPTGHRFSHEWLSLRRYFLEGRKKILLWFMPDSQGKSPLLALFGSLYGNVSKVLSWLMHSHILVVVSCPGWLRTIEKLRGRVGIALRWLHGRIPSIFGNRMAHYNQRKDPMWLDPLPSCLWSSKRARLKWTMHVRTYIERTHARDPASSSLR